MRRIFPAHYGVRLSCLLDRLYRRLSYRLGEGDFLPLPQSHLGVERLPVNHPDDDRGEVRGRAVIGNSIRPFVLGRKAWLISDTSPGAHVGAALYSISETAKAKTDGKIASIPGILYSCHLYLFVVLRWFANKIVSS